MGSASIHSYTICLRIEHRREDGGKMIDDVSTTLDVLDVVMGRWDGGESKPLSFCVHKRSHLSPTPLF